jgi:glutamine synthetase
MASPESGPAGPTRSQVLADAADRRLHSVRVCCVDQHGLVRTKTIDARRLAAVFESGIGLPGSLLAKDTGNNYAIPLWSPSGLPSLDALLGAQDMVMVPDPATWLVPPWLDGTGWLLCDLRTTAGEPIGISTRALCHGAAERLANLGYSLTAGLELELHLFDGATGAPIHPGWELLGGRHAEAVHHRLEPLRAGLTALGLSPQSVEVELGPGQVELSFAPAEATRAADQAVVIRHAITALASQGGMRASFVCRPSADAFPSGWHLHQSLTDGGGVNVFATDAETAGRRSPGDGVETAYPAASTEPLLSLVGQRWVAGLLKHAAASCLLTTPTVNGYKRYRPNSVAPDRIAWSRQHRGAMLRVIGGGADPATHVENRVGDPAANPYLYVASQLTAGVDGLTRELVPAPPTTSPYAPEAGPLLPRSLGEAIDAFAASPLYRRCWGEEAVAYLVAVKGSEWRRFQSAVTDWEIREYGELF